MSVTMSALHCTDRSQGYKKRGKNVGFLPLFHHHHNVLQLPVHIISKHARPRCTGDDGYSYKGSFFSNSVTAQGDAAPTLQLQLQEYKIQET